MAKKRRGRGEGSIFQRDDGQWVAKINLGRDEHGKRQRRTVYGATKGEVQKKLLDLQQRHSSGTLGDIDSLTLGQWLDAWLELRQSDVGDTTHDGYEQHIRLHIKPAIGGVKLRQLKPLHGEMVLRQMAAAGGSVAMQGKVIGTLRAALKTAREQEVLKILPAIKRPKAGRKLASEEIQVWIREEIRVFLKAAEADRYHALYVLAIDSGMRQGELFGLPWDAIDWEQGAVSVRQSLTERCGVLTLKEPKTATSRRRLRLAPWALSAMNAHRQRMVACGLYDKIGLVFVDRRGGPLRKSNFTRRSFDKILARSGVKPIRFHDLRHTAATTWLLSGINIKAVSARLGHAKIQITLDIYAHFLPEMDEEIVATSQALFG